MVASVVGCARTPSNGTDATGASLALTIPAGTAIGDYAVIEVELWDSTATNPTLTYPAGFTQIVNYVSTTDGFQKLKIATKKLTAADSGTYTVSGFASHFRQGHVTIIRGIDGTTALDVAVNLAQNSTGTALPANSLTTVTAGCLLLHAVCNENSSTGTPSTGYTEQADSNYLKTNTKVAGAAGTETPSGGSFSASTLKLGALIAFRPAASGTTVTGVVAASSALTATAAGRRTVRGTVVASSTLVATVSGLPKIQGSATAAAGLTATVAGRVSVPGVAGAGSSLSGAATGVRTVIGSATSGSSLTGTGSGEHGVSGTAAAVSGLTTTVTGVVTGSGTGAASGTSGLAATATGQRTVVGSAAAASELDASASGSGASTPVVTGTASAAAVLTAAAVGARTVVGALTASSSFTAGASGRRTIAGLLTADLAFTAQLFVPPPPEVGSEYWLTLGDLMEAREDQQSIMFDRVRLRHDEHTDASFDPDLGYRPTEMPEPYYDGPARVQARPVQSGTRDAGDQLITTLGYAVAVPYDVTEAVPGDICEVYESAYEPMHEGKVLRLQDVQSSTYVTARRFGAVDYQ